MSGWVLTEGLLGSRQGLQVGDKRFVIPAKWWERWCQYVDYDDDLDGTLRAVCPALEAVAVADGRYLAVQRT